MNASFDEKINKIPFHLSSLIHTFLCALSLFMKVKFLYYNDKEIYKLMTKILYFVGVKTDIKILDEIEFDK